MKSTKILLALFLIGSLAQAQTKSSLNPTTSSQVGDQNNNSNNNSSNNSSNNSNNSSSNSSNNNSNQQNNSGDTAITQPNGTVIYKRPDGTFYKGNLKPTTSVQIGLDPYGGFHIDTPNNKPNNPKPDGILTGDVTNPQNNQQQQPTNNQQQQTTNNQQQQTTNNQQQQPTNNQQQQPTNNQQQQPTNNQQQQPTNNPKPNGNLTGDVTNPQNNQQQQPTNNQQVNSGTTAADIKDCNDKATQSVIALFQSDKYNMLARMFELTAMKLAERALSQTQKATTLEELTHSKRKLLQKEIDEEKGAGAFKQQVVDTYKTYQKAADVKKVNDDFNHFSKANENACYWSNHTRLNNKDVSAYVLAVAASEPQSDLTELDAATIWVVEKARAAKAASGDKHYETGRPVVKGNEDETDKNGYGNLLNMSTRVARYLGRIDGARNVKDADTIKNEIVKEEESMQKAVDEIKSDPTIEAAFEKCAALQLKAEGKDPTCTTCIKDKVDSFEKSNITLESLKRGLLLAIKQSEDLKVDHDLKMKLGTNTFDFSNFAKSTSGEMIPKNPPRHSDDACKPVTPKRKQTLGQIGTIASKVKPGEHVHIEKFGLTCTVQISGVAATVTGPDGELKREIVVLDASKQVIFQGALDFGSCTKPQGCDNSIFGNVAGVLENKCPR